MRAGIGPVFVVFLFVDIFSCSFWIDECWKKLVWVLDFGENLQTFLD